MSGLSEGYSLAQLRRRLYEIVEISPKGDGHSWLFDIFMLVLIFGNIVAVMLETVPVIFDGRETIFLLVELISVAIFTIEYVTRIWVIAEADPTSPISPWRRRLRYAVSPFALIDLLAILPTYFSAMFGMDLRVLRLFRVLRILKLARYSTALSVMGAVITSERRSIIAAFTMICLTLVVASTLMYYAERGAQPDIFASIPHAMWWGVATLTTVGYGDTTPITLAGRLIGSFVMLMGIGLFALPTGIIASGFARELNKREFVVTWQMVASVPLFSSFGAGLIAEITGLLKPEVIPARYRLFKAGDSADAMYFIISGDIELDIPGGKVVLSSGDFLGEAAFIEDRPRAFGASSVGDTKVLVLEFNDFRRLAEINPELQQVLVTHAENRNRATREILDDQEKDST